MNKEKFCQITSNWDSHRPLLWAALEATKHLRLPVMELGCGEGSTPFLREYCNDEGLELFSYDYNRKWAEKYNVHHIIDWNILPHSVNAWIMDYAVVLIDESPGHHRKESIKKLQHSKGVLVVHDSEPLGWNASDYQVRPLFDRFKYVLDFEQPKPQAWATALSNTIDVTKFDL